MRPLATQDPTALARFEAKYVPCPITGCWLWTGAINEGYGWFRWRGRPGGAHRAAYELFVSPIPDGLELDHACRTPSCVNPAHLEPVTHRENVRRGDAGVHMRARSRAQTACRHGHTFDARNTYITRNGSRYCRACGAASRRRRVAMEARVA